MNRRDFLRTAGGAAGGASAAAVGAGTAVAAEGEEGGGGGGGSERPVWPSYVDDAQDGSYEDLRGESEVTVAVGPDGSLAYTPTNIWVDPGTTVIFEFVSSGHNVKTNSQPDGGGLAGTEGGEFATIGEGETYSVMLETGGMFTYYCGPHEGQGMKGAIAVGGDVETESVGGGGQTPLNPEHMGVPFHPHYVGVSTIVMMVVSIMFTFFLLKYGESPNAQGGNN